MSAIQQARKVQAALMSSCYTESEQRVLYQLMESLLYERLVDYTEEAAEDGLIRFIIHGITEQGQEVIYRCLGRRTYSFGRIRLERGTLSREALPQATAVLGQAAVKGEPPSNKGVSTLVDNGQPSPVQALLELFARKEAGENAKGIVPFTDEMDATVFKHCLSLYDRRERLGEQGAVQEAVQRQEASQRTVRARALAQLSYDELEAALIDGHYYHPSFKSRIGFDYIDQAHYGPEYAPLVSLIWVAAAASHTYAATLEAEGMKHVVMRELGSHQYAQYNQQLTELGLDPEQYELLPVHPWQWVNFIAPYYSDHIQQRKIILLGSTEAVYRPQQSIRTMAHAFDAGRSYLKLSLNIIQTSTSRYLSPHSVASASAVSEWLLRIVAGDAFLKEKLELLLEYAGVVYDPPPLDESIELRTYGTLACIWRENITSKLKQDEQAIPFNALFADNDDGTPFLQGWLGEIPDIDSTLEPWLEQLIDCSVIPIIHLLSVHGIALESHAQNMILIHRNGQPLRVALKDFHEGYYYVPEHLSHTELLPNFTGIHENFSLAKPNSLFQQEDIAVVIDTTMDSLFLYNLGELAYKLEQHYGYTEISFWKLLVRRIVSYYHSQPHLTERFQLFNIFAPTCQVEALTHSRLFPDPTVTYCHEVANPLYEALKCIQAEEEVLVNAFLS